MSSEAELWDFLCSLRHEFSPVILRSKDVYGYASCRAVVPDLPGAWAQEEEEEEGRAGSSSSSRRGGGGGGTAANKGKRPPSDAKSRRGRRRRRRKQRQASGQEAAQQPRRAQPDALGLRAAARAGPMDSFAGQQPGAISRS
ncbi:hypothetical protein E2320_005850 [Naja naja]|nr:hypothetical protein E2320_005850 [Naja naja]